MFIYHTFFRLKEIILKHFNENTPVLNVDDFFIAITPRFTLYWRRSTYLGPICESNKTA